MPVSAGHRIFRFEAVESLRRVTFSADVAELGHGGLHAVGGLVITDRGFDRRGMTCCVGELAIDGANEIEAALLDGVLLERANVRNRIGCIDTENRGLVLGGEESAAPLADSAVGRFRFAAFENDVAGEVAVLGAESIAGPGTHSGVSDEGEAGVEKEIPLGMLVDRTRHGAHHGEVVGAVGAQVRKEIRNGDATFTPGSKIKGAAVDVAVVVELGALDLHRHGFAVEFAKAWFGIKAVEVRDASGHVAEDDPFRPGAEVGTRNALGSPRKKS